MPRRGLTPAAVADAAVAAADADGLQAVTMARVAADLGVRPPSLYKHVASREELVRAIALRALADLGDRLTAAVLGRSGPDAIVAAATAYRDWTRERPGRAATVLRAPAPGDEAHAAAAARVVDVFGASLRDLDLNQADRTHAIRQLRAAVVGFTTLEAAGGFGLREDPGETFDRLIAAVVTALPRPT